MAYKPLLLELLYQLFLRLRQFSEVTVTKRTLRVVWRRKGKTTFGKRDAVNNAKTKQMAWRRDYEVRSEQG
jgi:hypothetical protein